MLSARARAADFSVGSLVPGTVGTSTRRASWRASVFEPSASMASAGGPMRSEEHTSELQSRLHLVCRLLLEKKKNRYDSCKRIHPRSVTSRPQHSFFL